VRATADLTLVNAICLQPKRASMSLGGSLMLNPRTPIEFTGGVGRRVVIEVVKCAVVNCSQLTHEGITPALQPAAPPRFIPPWGQRCSRRSGVRRSSRPLNPPPAEPIGCVACPCSSASPRMLRPQVAYWDPSGNQPVELTDLLIELKCIERTDQSWVSSAWGADAGPPLLKEGRRVSRQLLHAAARYSAQHLDLPPGSPQHFVFRYECAAPDCAPWPAAACDCNAGRK